MKMNFTICVANQSTGRLDNCSVAGLCHSTQFGFLVTLLSLKWQVELQFYVV